MSNLTPEDIKEIARIVREEVTAVLHPSVRAQQEVALHVARTAQFTRAAADDLSRSLVEAAGEPPEGMVKFTPLAGGAPRYIKADAFRRQGEGLPNAG